MSDTFALSSALFLVVGSGWFVLDSVLAVLQAACGSNDA